MQKKEAGSEQLVVPFRRNFCSMELAVHKKVALVLRRKFSVAL
jgi:hypothetical protein